MSLLYKRHFLTLQACSIQGFFSKIYARFNFYCTTNELLVFIVGLFLFLGSFHQNFALIRRTTLANWKCIVAKRWKRNYIIKDVYCIYLVVIETFAPDGMTVPGSYRVHVSPLSVLYTISRHGYSATASSSKVSVTLIGSFNQHFKVDFYGLRSRQAETQDQKGKLSRDCMLVDCDHGVATFNPVWSTLIVSLIVCALLGPV